MEPAEPVIISKAAAIAAGLGRYFTGVPCSNGHISERRVTGHCLACQSASMARWRSDNPERHKEVERASEDRNREKRNQQKREAGARWRERNPEKHRAIGESWRSRNKAKIKQANTQWYEQHREEACAKARELRAANPGQAKIIFAEWSKRNPERAKAASRASKLNRRTRELAAGPKAHVDDITALFKRQNGKCAGCRNKPAKLEIDHIRAVVNGGSNDRSNLQLLCRRCNASKGARDAIDWAQQNGLLL